MTRGAGTEGGKARRSANAITLDLLPQLSLTILCEVAARIEPRGALLSFLRRPVCWHTAKAGTNARGRVSDLMCAGSAKASLNLLRSSLVSTCTARRLRCKGHAIRRAPVAKGAQMAPAATDRSVIDGRYQMALTPIDQRNMGLTGGGTAAACGVACTISVLTHFGPPLHSANQIFRRTSTTRITRYLGSTPANIADYLISQERTVYYKSTGGAGAPITEAMAMGLRMSGATKLQNPPQHGPITSGGPPFFIHFLKIRGANPAGHFVVSDGMGVYMDPGAPGGAVVGAFPAWANFYDTGLTPVVE